MVSAGNQLQYFIHVNPYSIENNYNLGRIFTIRAKALEISGEIHIVIISVDMFIGNFLGRGCVVMFGRATDRQTDVINLSFSCTFLYIALFNIRPPEAGIPRKAVMPFHGFPSPAVFLRASYEQRSCRMCVSDRACTKEETHIPATMWRQPRLRRSEAESKCAATRYSARQMPCGVEVRCKDAGIR